MLCSPQLIFRVAARTLARILRLQGPKLDPPDIIAANGWSKRLEARLMQYSFVADYAIVLWGFRYISD
jgi:hypothetical protein